MPTHDQDEPALVKMLAGEFDGNWKQLSVGIGDDAAVLRRQKSGLVWSVDTAVEHVHFELDWLNLGDLGARAFQAAVSDLAAMGAKPLAALSSLILPSAYGSKEVSKIAKGQQRAARALACPVAGGNISRGRELSITTTVLGTVGTAILRQGAAVGEELWLVGDVGLAGAGCRALGRGSRPSRFARIKREDRGVATCIKAWREPRALIAEGQRLSRSASCMIDVSDGLATNATELAKVAGIRVVIEEHRLRAALRPDLVRAAAALDANAVQLALYGGEDYALLAAGPARKRPRAARVIGRFEAGWGGVLQTIGGKAEPLNRGYDHMLPPDADQ
ncbi:MAG: thiamine-phosphate kinase [Polyangiaceae bacterium]|nr:thiamine-phosphate kinase [Polyangiaceae bacterium]